MTIEEVITKLEELEYEKLPDSYWTDGVPHPSYRHYKTTEMIYLSSLSGGQRNIAFRPGKGFTDTRHRKAPWVPDLETALVLFK